MGSAKPPAERRRREILDDPKGEKAARSAALALLARRDYSSAELRTKLLDREFEAGLVDALVTALQREKLVDDRRYVENFVTYHAGRGQGPVRIAAELRRLKVDGSLIDLHLDVGQDWVARARGVRRKKFGAREPGSYAEKAKQARFLQYRGFTGSQVRSALGTDIDLDESHDDQDEAPLDE